MLSKKEKIFFYSMVLLLMLIAALAIFVMPKRKFFQQAKNDVAPNKLAVIVNKEIPYENQVKEIDKPKVEQISPEKIEANYIDQIKPLFADYLKIVNNINYSADDFLRIKDKLVNFVVPNKFRDLHLNLIFSVSRMEEFAKNNNKEDKIAGKELIHKIKVDYEWIN